MCICLLDRYSFPKENIKMLIDTDGYEPQPTGHNIRAALSDLVASAKAGDILFVHYSGHGTRLPSENGQDDDTGFDECIVPTDMNLITDDDFRKVVEKVPEGCIVTIVSDSCHSGGLIDNAKEQIGDSTKQRKQHQLFKSLCNIRQRRNRQMQSKSLPLPTLIAILKKKTGKNDIDAGKLRPTLFDIFGDYASPKVKKFMKVIMSKIPHKEGGGLMGMAVQYLQQKVGEGEAEVSRPENGILISGCQSDEISADMPDGEASEAYGAMSNAIQEIIAERDWRVSNGELVERARKLLKKQGILQHPGLYCSDRHVDAPFIC